MSICLALVQMSCAVSPADNDAKAESKVRAAAADGANVVCLQELFRTPYFAKTEDSRNFGLAEPVHAEASGVQRWARLAGELGIVLVVSLFETVDEAVYFNTAVVLDADGRYLGKYRKMHIPDDPLFLEKFYFAPGDLGYRTFRTRFGRVGLLICWDQWFPEAARLTALTGAELILYPTAIGYLTDVSGGRQQAPEEADAWQLVQRGHAVANGCFVAAVNRVGREESPAGDGAITFWGRSFVANPSGTLIAEAGSDEQTLLCEVDLGQVAAARREASYFLRDRRIDSYHDLTRRYLAGTT